MTSEGSSRSTQARRLTAAIAVVALVAAVLVGFLLGRRGQSETPGAGAAPSTPSSQSSEQTPAPVGTESAAGGAATCTAGGSGPLRQDTQFTASDGTGTVVPYSISVPDDYYSACRQYPVVYALHGKTQNNVSFLGEAMSMRKAMAAGVLEESIIVTPDSFATGRWENRETGPAEDNVIQRLIPYVEQNYRVKAGPSYRLLVGFSMGGHGALRFGLKYPQMFAAVWSVDGAMAGVENYLPFAAGRTSEDFRILAVGGQLNGDRVRTVVDALKQQGIELRYVHQDREHQFVAFVDEDEKAGWPAMKFLQEGLGRAL